MIRTSRRWLLRTTLVALPVLAASVAAGCGGGGAPAGGDAASSAASGGSLQINGAGATFPYPIYSKWFDEYHKRNGQYGSTTSRSDLAAASAS